MNAKTLLYRLLTLTVLIANGSGVAAQDRPKIGLVLEGGGALGFAHVGVLKVLEEERVPVDLIAGTSMGSIVGAAYASGQTIEELERTLATTDWDALFADDPPRSELPFRLKPGRNREIFGAAKVGMKDGKPVIPSALIEGQHILPVFQRLFDRAPYLDSFDDLPVPFRAVAADIETGEQVVLGSGDLSRAARASMAVPGVFSPVELDGRLLVDGGIRNNFPVNVAREMGAEIIIGSYFEYEFRKRQDLQNPLAVLGQMLDFLLEENASRSVALLGPRDVRIIPDVRKYSSTSFGSAREIMQTGEEAARKAVPLLRKHALSEEAFRAYQARRTSPGSSRRVDFLRVENSSHLPDALILRQIHTKEGEPFDRELIEEDLNRIYNLGELREARYELASEDGKEGVIVHVSGKEWMERYIRLGFALEDNFDGQNSYSLGVSLRLNDRGTFGGYTELDAEIGESPGFSLERYQPITPDRRLFLAPLFRYGARSIYLRQDDEILAEYRRTLGFGEIKLGYDLQRYGEATIGVRRGFGDLERLVGDQTLPDVSFDIGEVTAELNLDTLDTPDFPRSGIAARLTERNALTGLGAGTAYDQLSGALAMPFSWGENTLLLRTDFGVTFDPLPPEQSFALGGFLNLSGFVQGELTASDYAFGSATLFRRLSRSGGSLFGLDLLAGTSLEIATLRSDIPAVPDNSSIVAGSIFLGTDTPLIPIYLGLGFNDESEQSFYFVLGRLRPRR